MARWMRLVVLVGTLGGVVGCVSPPNSPTAGIRHPLAPPELPPPVLPAGLPPPPAPIEEPKAEAGVRPKLQPPVPRPTDVRLEDVLQSVEDHFPLLLAVEQERVVAAGQRLTVSGAFDLSLKGRASAQEGTFDNQRFDLGVEQATGLGGATFFTGYRLGLGDFPVYYGDRKTADGGEFRGGLNLPLLRDAAIDRRRALLRQAQLGEALAEPVIARARLDYLRNAARLYWTWVAAGQQYLVADALLRIASDRQAGLEKQFEAGQIAEFVVIDNRRLIAEREGALLAAERRFQQAAIDLSLYYRDGAGQPVVAGPACLPRAFPDTASPPAQPLPEDVKVAYNLRPELVRFRVQKERVAVDLQLAENLLLPGLNVALTGAQDVGKGKKGEDSFALDRATYEAALLLDVPLQRREARGRLLAAQGTMAQLLSQERFARDQINAEVQDARSNLDRTFPRLARAREEEATAQRVAELEAERFRKGQSTLLEVNLRELADASARSKVIDALADYYRAWADYRAALGVGAAGTVDQPHLGSPTPLPPATRE